jgi:hypothetical protein
MGPKAREVFGAAAEPVMFRFELMKLDAELCDLRP